MFRVLGIVQDLIDILRIRPFQEDDLRPPLLQECGDLDLLGTISREDFGKVKDMAEKR